MGKRLEINKHFYPRSPCGERQLHFLTVVRVFLISIHALLAESDLSVMYHNNLALSFLSTLSLRRATGSLAEVAKYATISIHALLAESDVDNKADHNPANQHFYPRSPCGERHNIDLRIGKNRVFLSTLSLRRATHDGTLAGIWDIFLSTLSLRRATLDRPYYNTRPRISIHALLAESDVYSSKLRVASQLFLSTLSLRRATALPAADTAQRRRFLSTLSLRRATHYFSHPSEPRKYFYPRSPCGERRARHHARNRDYIISIHALLAESDCARGPSRGKAPRFLSTLSLRRATSRHYLRLRNSKISIHALLAESDVNFLIFDPSA